ncbi:hypothetical protein H1S01_15485 [Heliobacterium chlorum]|uniref:Uncharacterized protein n=1 Tax=Heliobacterium chlorum TaxID=2698 RepID=A0ABR7T701_HELCL|nr:hypothetical protein [Heliobacterium chlorum]MBC9785887.1 hypothetical protein [Heliobacterium chlorum]
MVRKNKYDNKAMIKLKRTLESAPSNNPKRLSISKSSKDNNKEVMGKVRIIVSGCANIPVTVVASGSSIKGLKKKGMFRAITKRR